jgi:hypothetical protein
MDLAPRLRDDFGTLGLVSASCRFFHLQGTPLGSVGPCFAFPVSPNPYGPPNWRGPYGDVLLHLLFSLRVCSIRGHSLEFDFVLGSFVVSGDAFDAL